MRDAHALYLETLTELGPVGLLLLGGALLVPLIAGIAARRQPLTPYLVGAYAAFFIHAGIDWDWELGGVALTALLIGVLMLASKRGEVRLTRDRVRAPAILRRHPRRRGRAHRPPRQPGPVGRPDRDAGRTIPRGSGRGESSPIVHALVRAPLDRTGRCPVRERQTTTDALTSFRRAVEMDDREWSAWIGVAVSARGAERRTALERAAALFPGSDDRREIVERLAKSLDE